jgi:tetratricopeptide (TPR) repeat protein
MTRTQTAADCFETLLSRNPKSVAGLSGRGEARLRMAAEMLRRGENPASSFEAAFRDLNEAAQSDAVAKVLRAEAHVRRGEWKAASGRDTEADADYQAALVDTKAALAAKPLITEGWIWQGRARTLSAAFRPIPMIHYQEAISDFNKVLLPNPDHLLSLRFRADAHQRRATLKATRRGESGPDFQSAITDVEHILRLRPSMEKELRDALAACKAGLEASKK